MGDISLSKAVRSNLLSLQDTASMMAKTQERLSTGNKVNSALDNPTNFFTASGLNSRAGDLNSLMDGMANGIQTLEAADNGLSSITKTLESMQSTLRQARQDKSFQTASLTIDSAAIGTSSSKELSFSGGAFDSAEAVKLQNKVTSGNNGFDAEGTAGRAGTLTLQATSLNNNVAVNVSFTAADTAETTAAKINTQIKAISPDSGLSASVKDGQLQLVSTKNEAVTVGGTNEEYVGLAAADTTTADTDATSVGSSAVSGSSITGFTFQINGEDVAISTTNAGSATANGTAIAAEINGSAAAQKYGITASSSTGTLTLTQGDGKNFTIAGASALNLSSSTNGVRGSGAVTAATSTNEVKTLDALVNEINNTSDLVGKIRASNDNGKLRVENLSTKALDITGADTSGTINGSTASASSILGNSVRADLAAQFNELRDQLDKTADDASFNGINLLRGDNLKITFNETGTSTIDIQTKDGETVNAANLGVFDIAAEDLDSDTNIDAQLAKLKTALNDVRSQSSAFGSNLSVVQNRQDFTKDMINTLQTGASNLTLADMNEEAANLLALQTRQSLSSSSLSLASQADQSVLQLIR
jgi:flagellin